MKSADVYSVGGRRPPERTFTLSEGEPVKRRSREDNDPVREHRSDRSLDGYRGCKFGGGKAPNPGIDLAVGDDAILRPPAFGRRSVKRATDFIDDLARSAIWVEPTSIVLIERQPDAHAGVNWAATTSPLPASTRGEFEDALSKWRALELQLDWRDVAFDGDRRMLVRWIFEE